MGYRVEHQPFVPAQELPVHLREQYQEFIDEYYDMYYVFSQMSIYYKNVTFTDLLGWASKLKAKKARHAHAARHYDITPSEIDYLTTLLGPLCREYSEESLRQRLLPCRSPAIPEWMTSISI